MKNETLTIYLIYEINKQQKLLGMLRLICFSRKRKHNQGFFYCIEIKNFLVVSDNDNYIINCTKKQNN